MVTTTRQTIPGPFERLLGGLGDRLEIIEGFVRASPFPMWAKDYRGRSDGLILVASDAFTTIWGFHPETYRGKTDLEVWSHILPESEAEEIAAQFTSNDLAVLSRGQPIDCIERTPHARRIGYSVCRVVKWLPAPEVRIVMGLALPIPETCGICTMIPSEGGGPH